MEVVGQQMAPGWSLVTRQWPFANVTIWLTLQSSWISTMKTGWVDHIHCSVKPRHDVKWNRIASIWCVVKSQIPRCFKKGLENPKSFYIILNLSNSIQSIQSNISEIESTITKRFLKLGLIIKQSKKRPWCTKKVEQSLIGQFLK